MSTTLALLQECPYAYCPSIIRNICILKASNQVWWIRTTIQGVTCVIMSQIQFLFCVSSCFPPFLSYIKSCERTICHTNVNVSSCATWLLNLWPRVVKSNDKSWMVGYVQPCLKDAAWQQEEHGLLFIASWIFLMFSIIGTDSFSPKKFLLIAFAVLWSFSIHLVMENHRDVSLCFGIWNLQQKTLGFHAQCVFTALLSINFDSNNFFVVLFLWNILYVWENLNKLVSGNPMKIAWKLFWIKRFWGGLCSNLHCYYYYLFY